MKILFGFFLFLCLSLSTAVFGQYRFDNWTTDNGLPQNGVRQITQSPEGYLWFTTFDGLVRFDGVRFTTFNKSNTKGIINNRFTNIYADKDGTIYATTMEDGILTIYRDGVFSSIPSEAVPGHYIGKIEPGLDGRLRFLSEDDDRKSKSWYRLENDKFEFIEKEARFDADATITGKHGANWVVTRSGITEIRGESKFYVPLDLSRLNFQPNIFEDKDGSLWLGENYVHRIRSGEIKTFDESDGLLQNSIYHSFWQEADGSIWLSSGGASTVGVGLVQITGDSISLWGKNEGLGNTSIASVYNDREGTTWLATTKGLSRRRKQVIQGYSTQDGLIYSETYPMYRDSKDTVWIGTSKGLSLYRDGKFEPYELTPLDPTVPTKIQWRPGLMSVQSLFEDDKGKMWVGVNGGIFLVEDGKAEMLIEGYHVHAIRSDRHGNIWAATNRGLLRYNDYRVTAEYTVKDGLPNDFMTLVFEDSKGVMWFGGSGGLSRFEDGKFTNFSTKDGLVGNYVRTIYEDADGIFWIGTYDEGMSRLKDGKFFNYKEENGLYNSGVFAIEEDAAGFFWISSNRGIYRVKKQELHDLADGKIAKINSVGYGKADGMLSNECNGGRQPASLRTADGKIWFPTQEGIAVVDPAAELPNPMPPRVVVEEILSERQLIDFRALAVIEPGNKDIEIHYTGISLIKSEQIKFQYKLEGHDVNWIDAGTKRTAHYSYLPPGNYTFHVRAANSDGVWSAQNATVKLEMSPFFYQTKLFMVISVLITACLLFIGWKVSVRQLKQSEKKLSRLVAERTAELAKANENLHALANSDGLTKIGNRRRFESFLLDEWHRAVRFKTEISLIMIDIDHFKLYNDTYGHQAGDECLQRTAEAFADAIKRPTDLVARFGGEEFAIVLGGTDAVGALQIAEEAIANLRELRIPHTASATSEFLTVSAGIATMFGKFELSEIDLIEAADRTLYMAKNGGRDRIHAYDHMSGYSHEANPLAATHVDRVDATGPALH